MSKYNSDGDVAEALFNPNKPPFEGRKSLFSDFTFSDSSTKKIRCGWSRFSDNTDATINYGSIFIGDIHASIQPDTQSVNLVRRLRLPNHSMQTMSVSQSFLIISTRLLHSAALSLTLELLK
ncbi:hypothetical protein BB561_004190 [Smittium simulii]|uniref:Uncharacterized protein n=1 Tax=Smittium simulii TaxID=133385 RepID=A0A2T9YHL7_9FUNG|nr:hypothetical protein BB561_004190 [Smittium simulii]